MNSDSIPQESTVPVGTVAQKAIHADLAFFFKNNQTSFSLSTDY